MVPGGGEHQRAWEQEALGGIQSRVAVTDPAPGLPGVETMVLSESHRQHWLQLCAAETDALERLGAAPVVLDLVRLEALPPHWQARIRAEAEALS